MELRDYWRVLRHRWRIVVICTLVGLLLSSIVTILTPRTYEATSELFVAPEVGSTSSELMQGSDFLLDRVKSYVEIIDKAVVLEPVIEDIGLTDTVGELSRRVEATVVPETVVVEVTVQDGSANDAARIANAIAEEFAATAPTLEPMRADETAVVRITVVDPARVPLSPVSPQARLNLALGVLAGLAIGLAGAVAREALDRRVKGERDVKSLTDAPVMGHIPIDIRADTAPAISAGNAQTVRAEAMRQLRTNLQFLDVPQGERSYVITSSLPGEGKTLTAINLAITMAESGQRVCLVEADLRRPHVGDYLGLEGAVGLTDTLIGTAQWREVLQEYRRGLDVILAGTIPPNPSDLVASEAMEKLLTTLEMTYDVVIVDAPPLLPVTDAAVLTKRCAGAIVVVGCGRKAVTRAELAHSLEMLLTVGARVLGVLLNKVPQKGPNAIPVSTYSYQPPQAAAGKHSKRATTWVGRA